MNILYGNDGGRDVVSFSEDKWINGSLKMTVSIFAIFLVLVYLHQANELSFLIIEMNARAHARRR